MRTQDAIETYDTLLLDAATDVFDARRQFLRANFDGYVEDTYYVRDEGYFCWPAQEDGFFLGYTELTADEADVIARLEAEGFELLGVGLGRIACAFPTEYDELVVKLGRCGMGDVFGQGRRSNLVEHATYRNAPDDAPLLPCWYCAGRGEYAIYPRAEETGPTEVSATTLDELRSVISRFAPTVDLDELSRMKNLCRWDGAIRTLDYAFPADVRLPYGVPAHVDGNAVIEAVDERRRRGTQRDLKDGGGFV